MPCKNNLNKWYIQFDFGSHLFHNTRVHNYGLVFKMRKSIFLSKKLLLTTAVGAIFLSSALASLYVSPVTKDSASVNYVNQVVSGGKSQQRGNEDYFHQKSSQRTYSKSGVSSTGNLFAQAMSHDDKGAYRGQQGNVGFGISAYNQTPTILMNQGKDIPLFVAVESIVPDVGTWMVHYDHDMHNLDMTWSGGDTWEGVLNTMAMQNDIFVEINSAERVIGLGKSANIAKHLAKKVPTVWRVDVKKSLRENMKDWAEKAGWTLSWDKDLMIDYPVEHQGVFTGEFVGEGGAVSSLLSTYRNADVPLKVQFYKRNKVVRVLRGGFEQELSY